MAPPRPLQLLAQILAAGDPAAHARFLEEVGDLTIRPSMLRCPYPVKTLLRRWADLRPHVRTGLEADLRQRWEAFALTDAGGADIVPKVGGSPSPVSAPLQGSPAPRNQYGSKSGVARREDVFDRFLGWLAGLLGR